MGAWRWQSLLTRSFSSVREAEYVRNARLRDPTIRVRPMKILMDPGKETLFFARNAMYTPRVCTDWLVDVYHRCHDHVCTRDRNAEAGHFDPFSWSRCRVEECHVKAFEMAGGVTMFVPGTMYLPSVGVVLCDSRAKREWEGSTTLVSTGGIHIFSAPVKSVEYEALEWLEEPEQEYSYGEPGADHFNMEIAMNREKFIAGAQLRNVSIRDAKVQCFDAEEQGIRPSLVLHRFSLCKGDVCWFPPLKQLRKLRDFAKEKMPLREVLEKLELPEVYIEDSLEEGLSYSVKEDWRSIAIKLIPARGDYHPCLYPASCMELARKKYDAVIRIDAHEEKKKNQMSGKYIPPLATITLSSDEHYEEMSVENFSNKAPSSSHSTHLLW